MESGIVNARIESTFLGIEDHGIMTFMLRLRFDTYIQGYGGYAIDQSQIDGRRVGIAKGIIAIREILETVGVYKWENLTGEYVRVRMRGHEIEAIGNVLKDRWFSFGMFFGGKIMEDENE